MKLFLVIVLFPALAFCQGFLPRWEMSMSLDANTVSANNSYTSFELRPGFYPFLGEGISIEPELAYGRVNGKTAFDGSADLSYSLDMGYWPVVPFVLVGYGLGDGTPFTEPLLRSNVSGSTDVSLINIGGGGKVMAIGGRALLRLEYRYQDFSFPKVGNVAAHHVYGRRIMLGFGVLL